MSNTKFIGTDVNLVISLTEYDCVVQQSKDGDYFCIYQVGQLDESGEMSYAAATITEDEVNKFLHREDVKGYLSYLGESSLEEHLKIPFVHKIQAILNYYGSWNIFGEPGILMKESEAIEMINS